MSDVVSGCLDLLFCLPSPLPLPFLHNFSLCDVKSMHSPPINRGFVKARNNVLLGGKVS